jgi:hypothetical protein
LAGACAAIAFTPVVLAARPTPPPELRSPLETALRTVSGPIEARRVVRDASGSVDVWLLASQGFDAAAELARAAVSSRRDLAAGHRLTRFTWIEPDRSYLIDLAGQGRTWRVRLTAHLQGTLWQIEGGGDVSEAPRWAPTWRPAPVLLRHGPAR